MADAYIKIIPTEPRYSVSESVLNEITENLKSFVLADAISAEIYKTPHFIDCGANLEEIKCPICEAALSFDWWGKAMDDAAKTGFEDIEIILPYCSTLSSLNDLKYQFPCGFAEFELSILNPVSELSQESIRQIEFMLKTSVRIIHSYL